MKINLAIYTATEGFDWQPGSVYSRVELNKYKEMIGRFPDILMEDVPYGGIFVCEGRLVFYRFHKAQRWDSRGRDALYCVLGTIPLDAGRKVNLSRVFETREFSAPMRPFPVSVEIAESLPIRPPSTWEELEEGLNAASSAAQVGVYATFFGHGKFFCRLDGRGETPPLKVAYENCDLKPVPKVVPRPEPVAAPLQSPASYATSAVQEQHEQSRAEIEKRLLAQELDKRRIESENQNLKNIIVILGGVIVLALVVGIGAFVLLREDSAVQNPERPSGLISGVDHISDNEVVKTILPQEEGGAKNPPGITNITAKVNVVVSTPHKKSLNEDVSAHPANRPEQDAHLKGKGTVRSEIVDSTPTQCQGVDPTPVPEEKARTNKIANAGSGVPKTNGNDVREQLVKNPEDADRLCETCKGEGVCPVQGRCPKCNGAKYTSSKCQNCRGIKWGRRDRRTGKVVPDPHGDFKCQECDEFGEINAPCDNCKGTGVVMKKEQCKTCRGSRKAAERTNR